ncbi:WD40-repeat-containing domain protein [Scheffersomyces xylosifermentans]|uniref:WD40-repeat-containing domain protein n=1 Tax=Scheffersomyces xylosifermentans TaxID=1304137 RepID=UPI00315D0F23
MSERGFNAVSSVNEEIFTPLNHYGPVTGLTIYKKYILAGNGCILKIFKVNRETNKVSTVFSQQVFKRNKIHNISVSPSGERVVVNGGRSFAVLNLTELINSTDKIRITEKAINEWIITSEFLGENQLLILNSHNTIYHLDVSDKEPGQKFKLLDTIDCNEKSILYSGSIRLLDDGRILIAAGTVMSGVLIWEMNSKRIVHNLTEHEGSIFGVKIDRAGKYMISCSDDRSIKLYDFEKGQLLATGWGHGSRIWNLEFFKDSTGNVRIMSTGEDCTVRIWKFETDNELLIQEQLWENVHRGKHVWSGDIDDVDLQVCVTGGADGRIRLHDLVSSKRSTKDYTLDIVFEKAGIKSKKNEIIIEYFELPSLNYLIMSTSQGNIIVFDQVQETFTRVELASEETEKFVKFGLMKGFQDLNTVILCTRNGSLLLLKFAVGKIQPEKTWINDEYLQNNKVTNFMVEVDENRSTYYLFIDTPNHKTPFILRELKADRGQLTLTKTILLNQPHQTSFTTTDMVIDSTNNWLILGSRYVTLAVYDLSSGSEALDLQFIGKKLSSGDTITSVSIIESKHKEVSVLVTVRDGVYMYIKISQDEDSKFHLNIYHHNKVSRGFIEGGLLENQNLILYGFKSSYFYVWNETKQLEITSELCGGSHRQWELFKYENHTGEMDYKFVYINKSTLNVKEHEGRFSSSNYGLINDGTHGREIRDLAISPELLGDGSRLLMTASEDTTIRLNKLHPNGTIENFWSLNNHVSGMQRVKFLSKEYFASSAANEEFFIWKLGKFKDEIPVTTEYARLKPASDNPDLRVMDFDSYEYAHGFIIATVYSNSNIKIWLFDINSKSFQLVVDDFYATCCILNVNFIRFGDDIFLQIGATDGHIAIWNITQNLSQFTISQTTSTLGKSLIKQQLHQNGIKGLLIKQLKNKFRIVTGGDDNSLILSELTQKNNQLFFETLDFVEEAASSTITSICSAGEDSFIVTSVDQIIRKWKVSNGKLECESARYTTIADTGCSDSVTRDQDTMAVIGGAGVSSWSC